MAHTFRLGMFQNLAAKSCLRDESTIDPVNILFVPHPEKI
jgi:hypothetical protein